jgi:hypothetical protein
MVGQHYTLRKSIATSNIVRHNGDTIAKVCWNHPHYMLLRDLVGPRFAYHGMFCYCVWLRSYWRKELMNFDKIYMKVVNFL